MQTTLYKTATPEKFVSEYYEMAILHRPGGNQSEYVFIELHGWWDESQKQAMHNTTTICPEEGMTFEEAQKMYDEHVNDKAHCGFVYAFTQNPFGYGPTVIKP